MKILNEVELNEVAKGIFDTAVENLKDVIADDYVGWTNKLNMNKHINDDSKRAEFKGRLSVAKGKKYWKIIADNSCWGFIVATSDDKLFKKGDILKSAGWSKPARNAPRGNVLDGNFTGVRWTGPAYLR